MNTRRDELAQRRQRTSCEGYTRLAWYSFISFPPVVLVYLTFQEASAKSVSDHLHFVYYATDSLMHTTETFSVHVPQIFFVSEIYACSFHANFKPIDLLFLNEIRMQISIRICESQIPLCFCCRFLRLEIVDRI